MHAEGLYMSRPPRAVLTREDGRCSVIVPAELMHLTSESFALQHPIDSGQLAVL